MSKLFGFLSFSLKLCFDFSDYVYCCLSCSRWNIHLDADEAFGVELIYCCKKYLFLYGLYIVDICCVMNRNKSFKKQVSPTAFELKLFIVRSDLFGCCKFSRQFHAWRCCIHFHYSARSLLRWAIHEAINVCLRIFCDFSRQNRSRRWSSYQTNLLSS